MAAQNTCILLVTAAILLSERSGVLCEPLCLTGDFDSQLRHILHEQVLSPQDHIISRALEDVQTTLNQRWQDYELIICGSLATGLGIITSDLDLVVNIPYFNASAALNVLQETKKLFNKQPELYTALRYNEYIDVALFAFFHIPSHRKVEIAFRAGDFCISSSQLVRYYFHLDKRFIPLGGFLKYFFSTHDVTGHEKGLLPGYGLYMLIIFYLQQKNMAPTGNELQVNSKSHFIDNWDMGFNELPYISTNIESLHQLLGGFFKYYSEFNFEEYIVSPFTGRPIPRSAFKDINNFPQEYTYTLYNNTLQHSFQIAIQTYLNLTTDLCIQDIFVHDLNTGELMSHEQATKFKHLMKSVATMFEDLPGESILGAILVMDQPKKKVICHKQSSAGGRHEQDCIDM